MTEKTLKAAIDGNKDAFKDIYEALFDNLWKYTRSRCANSEIASDITAESFAALFENIENIKYTKAVKTYLYRICQNKLKHWYKREKSVSFENTSLDEVIADQDSLFEKQELIERTKQKNQNNKKVTLKVEEILKNLPESYEEVLRLRFLAKLKIKETAEIMDTSEGNIKVMQHRALKKAKKIALNLFKNNTNI